MNSVLKYVKRGEKLLFILKNSHLYPQKGFCYSFMLTHEYLANKSIYFCILASGTSRRPWVLGKVMEKEYCQAKKVLYYTCISASALTLSNILTCDMVLGFCVCVWSLEISFIFVRPLSVMLSLSLLFPQAQNRFKVPLGTKFYRVKAVPWNRKV